MRIVIIGQEEPVYFSPFLRRIIEARPGEVVLVVLAGDRGAGDHAATWRQTLENLYILWLIMEPYGFFRNLVIRGWHGFLKALGPWGAFLDHRSVLAAARRYHIPVMKCRDLNSIAFVEELRRFSPDVIINQSELLLKDGILSVPKIGIINRHASLLPRFRGRLGSWWSHAGTPPEYGVTIHFVNRDIDSGPIILQKHYEIDPGASYCRVLDILFDDAPNVMMEALDKIQDPGFVPAVNPYQGTQTCLFPSLRDVKQYRNTMKKRRAGAV